MNEPHPHTRTRRAALTSTIAAVAVIAICFAVYFADRVREQAAVEASLKRELAAKRGELSTLQERLSGGDAAPAVTPIPLPPSPQRTAATASPIPSVPGSSHAAQAAFRTPAMREMVRQSRLTMLRPIYDPLLAQLNLSPEQRDQFYDSQVEADDPGLTLDKLPKEADTIEEKAGIDDQIRQHREAALQHLKDLLGQQGYDLYDSYRATQGERMLIEQFRRQADPRAPQMTDWQYDRLRDLLIQARSQYPPVNDDFSASYAAALTQASQVLTPDQLASFRKYLQNQQDIRNAMQAVLLPGG